jgi:hypothetical protein
MSSYPPTGATARPAAVNDEVRDGTAVRTGVDSRSELKFTDQTLARLGANTLFSFSEGTRDRGDGSDRATSGDEIDPGEGTNVLHRHCPI